jgi:cytochrome c553
MNRVRNLVSVAALMSAVLMLVVPGRAAAQVDKKVLRTWKAKCASCHGDDGKGATEQGKKMGVRDMTSAEFWKDATDAKMKAAIENGIKQTKNGKAQEMEAFKDKIKPEDVTGLIALVKTLKT